MTKMLKVTKVLKMTKMCIGYQDAQGYKCASVLEVEAPIRH